MSRRGAWTCLTLLCWLCLTPAPRAQQSARNDRPSLAFVYGGGESTGPAEIRRALAPLGLRLGIFAPGSGGDLLAAGTDLASYDVVFVDGAMAGLERYAAQLRDAAARTRVAIVASKQLAGNVDLEQHPWLARYWANPSQRNYARLARYLLARVAAHSGAGPVEAPIEYPAQGFYHPDAPDLFADATAYLAWYRGRGAVGHAYDPAKLTLGVFFNMTSYQIENLDYVDALIRGIERRGHNAIAFAFKGSPALDPLRAGGQPLVDALIFAGSVLNLKDREAAMADAQRLGVPILGALTHTGMTAEAFAQSPAGLHPALTGTVVEAERDGRIEPIVTGGRGGAVGDRHETVAFARQVDWRIERALSWARLHRTPNGRKRIVFTYWSEGGGKANIGGDPDDFLDVQASLVRLLGTLRERGYDLGPDPLPDRDTLARRMALSASNVGTWAPGELAARVRRGEMQLIPESVYRRWFDALPAARRDEIVAMWGPPPGNVMVHRDAQGRRFLAIPALRFGNVLVAAHPDWGYLQDQKALLSTGALPPHHQYMAFFLWLQHQWKADAWVSLFTNISLQAGKSEGPAADDHVALLLGAIPHIHPERLGANGGVSNKRKAMAQTVGWYNIVGPAGDGDEAALRPAGTKVLGDAPAGQALTGMVTAMLGAELRDALEQLAPGGSRQAAALVDARLNGIAAEDALLAQFGRSAAAAAAELGRVDDYAARLRTSSREVDGILTALDGGWIEPGPMDDPVRRPDALPPGRALYNFDQAAIPTPEAEAVGIKQAEALIAAHRTSHGGAYPKTMAFVIWSGEIAKNLGATEAQVLHLLGTRPVRNARGEVTGVALIPRGELGRPRVDVVITTSGTYRDHYQDKVELMAEAVRLAAASPEADNPVAAATRASRTALEAGGTAADRAAALAQARIFSPAPGAYSPNIQFLAKAGDQRGDERQMADLYSSRMSHAYGAGLYGESARPVFEQRAAAIDAITLPRSGSVNGMLDQPMSAGFLGGLNLAARAAGAQQVDLYVSNLRDPSRPGIESAAEALQTEMRTRYFDRAWLTEMKAHGYDGARNLMFFADNLDLWDSTATDVVSSADWDRMKRVYVEDSLDLDLDGFMDRYNPHAQQVMLANLLGAASRGHWQASAADRAMVAARLARSAAQHGAVCSAAVCRNPALTAAVTDALRGTPDGAALTAAYSAALGRATNPAPMPATTTTTAAVGTAPGRSSSAPGSAAATPGGPSPATPAAPPLITGLAMHDVTDSAAAATEPAAGAGFWWLLLVAMSLLGLGWLRSARKCEPQMRR